MSVPHAPAAPVMRHVTELPFTPSRAYGIPLISVRLNGQQTATCALDTGTSVNILTDTMAAKLGLKPTPLLKYGKPMTLDGEPERSVSVDLTELGEFRLHQAFFLVLSHDYLAKRAGDAVDGVIGAESLANLVTLIDFPHHVVALLYPGNLTPGDLQAGDFVPQHAITLDPAGGVFTVSAVLENGKNKIMLNLFVDTGSPATLIPWTQAKRLRLQGKVVRPASGSYPAELADDLTFLRFGPLSLPSHHIYFMDRSFDEEITVLGLDVLSGYRVLLDLPAKKMYLSPASQVIPLVKIAPAAPAAEKSN